jgi:hypothetical protein
MSNPTTEQEESLIYVGNEPDVAALQEAYSGCLLELEEYFDDCLRSYEDRRNIWPGKTTDLRKNAVNAFPWQGASDMEVNVVGERINAYVALFDQALERSHIRAFPTSMAAMPRAGVVSSFLKWMRNSYIPNFKEEMELGANHLLEKGLMVTYVGWQREKRSFLQRVTLDEIAQASPEIAEQIALGADEEELIQMVQAAFPSVNAKRAKRAIRDLQKMGITEIPVARTTVDRPIVNSCAPDGEVIFPPYVSDPQRAPYVFWRTFLTPQELEKKAANEGWDAKWVENAIQNLRGKDSIYLERERQSLLDRMDFVDDNDLIMVVYGYQRLIDEEDGSEGIYCTVFHPSAEGHAKYELLNGYDDYPFIVTRLSYDQKRMYEVQTFSDLLRGAQLQIKTERDQRIDRASLSVLPPLMHPAGRPPTDWGPGRRVPYRRLGEIAFGPIPPADPAQGSVEVENAMRQQANAAIGLDLESPLAQFKQQFYISKYLDHVKEVLSLAWKLFQRMGPDEVFFQVSGIANPQIMQKGNGDEDFSIMVNFDSQSTDPENAETQLKNMISLVQFDRNGRIDMDKLLEFIAATINPSFADYILQPAEEAQEKAMRDVTDDLSKIYAGIEVPARPNGAQVALQLVQAYVQQPDVAQRAQQDPSFAERLQKYAGQYQFQMQQQQNAEIGRIGTAPAQMGGANTQAMQQ